MRRGPTGSPPARVPSPRLAFELAAFAAWLAVLLMLAGCARLPARPLAPCTIAHAGDTHNSCGGYIPACGKLPPLVGDDC